MGVNTDTVKVACSDDFNEGSTCQQRCADNSEAVGNDKVRNRTCTGGIWNGLALECLPIQPTPAPSTVSASNGPMILGVVVGLIGLISIVGFCIYYSTQKKEKEAESYGRLQA